MVNDLNDLKTTAVGLPAGCADSLVVKLTLVSSLTISLALCSKLSVPPGEVDMMWFSLPRIIGTLGCISIEDDLTL